LVNPVATAIVSCRHVGLA
jgi:hypothetical protein